MATGQGVAFALSPLLSRLYSPSDFGHFAVFSSCFSFLTIALTLRYEQAILYAKSALAASELVTLSLLVSAAMSLGVIVIAAFLDTFGISGPLGLPEIVLLVVSSICCTSQRVASTLWNRWRQFRQTAILSLFRAGLVGLMQLLAGLTLSQWGLVTGHTLAYVALLVLTWTMDPRMRRFVRPARLQALKHRAQQYSSFPKYNMTQNLLYVGSELIIPILMVDMFGQASAGLYWLAARVTMAPAQVLIESIRGITYREVSANLNARREIRGQLVKWALGLAGPFILGAALVGLCGSSVFGLVFGARWEESSRLAVVLFGFAAVQAACVPYIGALPIIKAGQRTYVCVEAAALAVRIAVFIMCAKAGVFACLALSSAAGACIYLAFLGWTHRSIGGYLAMDGASRTNIMARAAQ